MRLKMLVDRPTESVDAGLPLLTPSASPTELVDTVVQYDFLLRCGGSPATRLHLSTTSEKTFSTVDDEFMIEHRDGFLPLNKLRIPVTLKL